MGWNIGKAIGSVVHSVSNAVSNAGKSIGGVFNSGNKALGSLITHPQKTITDTLQSAAKGIGQLAGGTSAAPAPSTSSSDAAVKALADQQARAAAAAAEAQKKAQDQAAYNSSVQNAQNKSQSSYDYISNQLDALDKSQISRDEKKHPKTSQVSRLAGGFDLKNNGDAMPNLNNQYSRPDRSGGRNRGSAYANQNISSKNEFALPPVNTLKLGGY